MLISCQHQAYPTELQPNLYAGYLSLADARRHLPGIQVSGSGDYIKVGLSRTSGSSGSVIYLVDGRDLGRHYRVVNESIDMNNVLSIRLLRGLADQTRFGRNTVHGAIEIWTR
ncbi:MAG: TonB-dependent receptor plug domain-containing protein [Saprospiraceae bacterium]|nr:TonB-dependent receptor plug domain-containing protein [Saprospiraceae bacterium]